jgi:glycosyltransferase involved in cell wall biosynthesis
MIADPLVTVVVPTVGRPMVVLRAVRSVLEQTYRDFELIVVIDGPDEATRDALSAITDSRLRIFELSENGGVSKARNLGVSRGIGQWIAFLDDDDEWLPGKLEAQVGVAKQLGGERILLASHYVDKGLSFERVMPERKPKPREPLSEFMFCRKGILSRSGNLQTSTYFVSRHLAQHVPFRSEVRPQEDFDWLMRLAAELDRPFQLLAKPLSIYHNEENVNREGAAGDFETFWNYAHQNRALFTPKAFSFYLATWCAPRVHLSPHPMLRWIKVYRGMKTGNMTPRALLFAVLYAIFPLDIRRRIRLFLSSVFSPSIA